MVTINSGALDCLPGFVGLLQSGQQRHSHRRRRCRGLELWYWPSGDTGKKRRMSAQYQILMTSLVVRESAVENITANSRLKSIRPITLDDFVR
ncbi:hypothetical protein ElyMa_000265000 [Elysia marginata]|uniref:Uncharacterized protein n=1 Tax=Elysia marginata TaxID=1093978 RepID=A0AAV4F6J5_9GAST|nr:hypothetical protein ElyMa_000265000 [Elysia marginata]